MGGPNQSRKQQKEVFFFQVWVREILKKGNILHVSISVCSASLNY